METISNTGEKIVVQMQSKLFVADNSGAKLYNV